SSNTNHPGDRAFPRRGGTPIQDGVDVGLNSTALPLDVERRACAPGRAGRIRGCFRGLARIGSMAPLLLAKRPNPLAVFPACG
ncbi:MAG: hypothetical protein OEU92_25985, partial [Alphaproteobacteria bacterium]|nr:hypothetical protein [Alphaproteobacteria bacterium]